MGTDRSSEFGNLANLESESGDGLLRFLRPIIHIPYLSGGVSTHAAGAGQHERADGKLNGDHSTVASPLLGVPR